MTNQPNELDNHSRRNDERRLWELSNFRLEKLEETIKEVLADLVFIFKSRPGKPSLIDRIERSEASAEEITERLKRIDQLQKSMAELSVTVKSLKTDRETRTGFWAGIRDEIAKNAVKIIMTGLFAVMVAGVTYMVVEVKYQGTQQSP